MQLSLTRGRKLLAYGTKTHKNERQNKERVQECKSSVSSEMDFIVLEFNPHLSLKIINQGINNLWMTS